MTDTRIWKNCRASDFPEVQQVSIHVEDIARRASTLISGVRNAPPDPPAPAIIIDLPEIDVVNAEWTTRDNPAGTLNGTYTYTLVPVDNLTGRVGDPVQMPDLEITTGQEGQLTLELGSPVKDNVSVQVQRDGEWVGPLISMFELDIELMIDVKLPVGFYTGANLIVGPNGSPIGSAYITGFGPNPLTAFLGPPVVPLDTLWFNDGNFISVPAVPPLVGGLLPPRTVMSGIAGPGVGGPISVFPLLPTPIPTATDGFFTNLGGPQLLSGFPGPGTPAQLLTSLSIPLSWTFVDFGQFDFSVRTVADASIDVLANINTRLPDAGYDQELPDVINTIKGEVAGTVKNVRQAMTRTSGGLTARPDGSRPFWINDAADVPVPVDNIRVIIDEGFDGATDDWINVLTDTNTNEVTVAVFTAEQRIVQPASCPPGQAGTVTSVLKFTRFASRNAKLSNGEQARVYWKNETARFKIENLHKLRLWGLDREEVDGAVTLRPTGRLTHIIDLSTPPVPGFTLPEGSTYMPTPPTVSPTAGESLEALQAGGLTDAQIQEVVADTLITDIDVTTTFTFDKVSDFLTDVTSPYRPTESGMTEVVAPDVDLLFNAGNLEDTFGACLPGPDEEIPVSIVPVMTLVSEINEHIQNALDDLIALWETNGVRSSIDMITYAQNLVFDFDVFRCQFGGNTNDTNLEATESVLADLEASLSRLETFFEVFSLSLESLGTATCIPLSILGDLLNSGQSTASPVPLSAGFGALQCSVGQLDSVSIPLDIKVKLDCALEMYSTINTLTTSARVSIRELSSICATLQRNIPGGFKISAAGCSGPDVAALARLVGNSITVASE